MIGKPKIDQRAELKYLGIRTQTPMRGMFAVVGKLFKELNRWLDTHSVVRAGVPFLRYHVIDMAGEMDVEVGCPVKDTKAADERVKSGVLPGGKYASLIFSGSGLAGNKALIEWVRAQKLNFDRWDTEKGDNFRSRFEAFLTDPKIEPRKTKWDIEVAIKLADSL